MAISFFYYYFEKNEKWPQNHHFLKISKNGRYVREPHMYITQTEFQSHISIFESLIASQVWLPHDVTFWKYVLGALSTRYIKINGTTVLLRQNWIILMHFLITFIYFQIWPLMTWPWPYIGSDLKITAIIELFV